MFNNKWCGTFWSDSDDGEREAESSGYGGFRNPTCKFCGKKGLWWTFDASRWFLVNDSGERHLC